MSCVPAATLERNARHAKTLGLPSLGEAQWPYLAVVGGGPSVADYVEELRAWGGEIWAINGAYKFLRDRGILSRFITFDPKPEIAKMAERADSAIMATVCDPAAFSAAFHAHVELVDLDEYPCGPTTASTVPIVAIKRGSRQIHFFGCEGSFRETTHAYDVDRDIPFLKVTCNGSEFLTSPQMYHQTQYLADVMRVAPHVFIDRSGGLLGANIADPGIDVIAASRSIYEAVMAA